MVTSFTVTGASRLLIAVVLVWILIIFVIAGPFFRWSNHHEEGSSSSDNAEMILARLSRANSELSILKAQNEELKNQLQNYLPEVKITSVVTNSLSAQGSHSTLVFEEARRRLVFNINELWFYLKNRVNSSVLSYASQMRHNLMFDLEVIEDRDFEWRNTQLKQLAELVQNKLIKLQNPEKESCSTAKKLVCQLNKGCGFGCQIHHLSYCMIVAMATRRTLIMNSRNWRYAHSAKSDNTDGWESVFLPMSETCLDEEGESRALWSSNDMDQTQVIDLPIIDSIRPRPPYLPLAVPQEISSRLKTLHGAPIVWFIGQVVKYIMRPSEEMLKYINKRKNKFKFKNPIVGVHVRRTDKIGTEASFHSLSEYMSYVEDYYDKLELFNQRNGKIEKVRRRVYLATDDPAIWSKEIQPYKDKGYIFLGDSQIAKTASVNRRYSIDSLKNIILDIWLLSECDHLVCTFSSQVCRLAYELMQTKDSNIKKNLDRHDSFISLDDIYYFGGQSDHNQIAILSHKATSDNEINLRVGDLIGIAGNHWNGFSKGYNRMNKQNGLYPGFKTIEKVDEYPFKVFQDD